MKKRDILFNLLVIVTFVGFAIFLVEKTFQNDTFYTIKVGEIISKYGVDMKDHFSFIPNLEYTYPHALYDLIIYFIYHLFGYAGIYVSVIITSIILFLLMYYSTNYLIKDRGLSYILTCIAAVNLKNFLAARAQLVSYIYLLLILFFIERLRETGKKRYIIFMILPGLLLTNMHAAVYPVVFILFLPFLASDLVFVIRKKYKKTINNYQEKRHLDDSRIEFEKPKNTKLLFVSMIVLFIVGFISLTPDAYTYIFKIRLDNSMSYINEHSSITIKSFPNIFISLMAFIFIFLLGNTKVKIRDFFMLGGLFFLAFLSNRSTALFYLLSLYSTGRIYKMFIDKRLLFIKVEDVFLTPPVYVVFMLIFLVGCPCYYQLYLKKDFYINKEVYPVEMVNYIKENMDYENMRIYNEYNFGSYMLLNGLKVFIDSRCDLYNDAFNEGVNAFDDYMEIGGIYKLVFDKYDVTHALLYRNNYLNLTLELDPNYRVIHDDKNFVLYERVTN